MKIIAIANGGFAVPTLQTLKESHHSLSAVFAMPTRTNRVGKKAGISPVREAVDGFLAGIPFFDPENINSPESVALLKSFNADIIFVCDYGKILSNDVLKTTTYGGLNLHGSILPKYRGAAPINRAIQNGERELGVSVIFIEPKMDAGPIVAVSSYTPEITDDAVAIEAKLAQMGAPLVLEALDMIEKGKVVALPQDPNKVSKAPKIKKEEGRIDWNQSSSKIIDQYRAFQPWPRVFSEWICSDRSNEGIRVILGPFSELDERGAAPVWSGDFYDSVEVGTILETNKTSFWIKTGDGALRVLAVQPAGKNNMTSEVFIRGYRPKVGDMFR